MHLYSQDSSRSYAPQATYMSQHTRSDMMQPEQQLPPIRDVIPPPSGSESTTPDHTGSIARASYLHPHTSSAMGIPTLSAPVHSLGSSIGYGQSLGSTHPMSTPSTSPTEYSPTWSVGTQQYDTPNTVSSQGSLPSQTQSFPSMPQSVMAETPDHGQVSYSSSYAPLPKTMSYSSNESPTADPYRWRSNQMQSTPRYTPYVMSDRSYPQSSPDYSRYGQASYDQYRNNVSYLESSPYAMRYSQCINYPLMGYASTSHGRRRRGNLAKHITDMLRLWLQDHLDHPYPTDEQKQMFIARTGLSISQISNWFINARRRQLPQLKAKRDKQRVANRVQKL